MKDGAPQRFDGNTQPIAKSGVLFCVRLTDESENLELVPELLAALDLNASSFEDRENNRIWHVIYADAPETAANHLLQIRNALKEWELLGVQITGIEPFELKKEDWAEVWKRYFTVIPVSKTLVVKPSWLDVERAPGMTIVEIDPGMSFGTGQHATTFYCLKTIDRLAGKPGIKSMLDAGCGSGILSIAATLRGFAPVDAFDNDPDAVRIACENLALNHISSVKPFVGDAAVWQCGAGRYDLVCANILGHLLIAFRKNISGWVRSGGYLALAGILSNEFAKVTEAFAELGFEELERETVREWSSGLFRKQLDEREKAVAPTSSVVS